MAASVQRLAATEEMAAAFGFSQQIRSAMIRRLEALVGRPMSDFDMLTMNRQDPIQVVHDRADKEAAHAEAEQLATYWHRAEHVTTDGWATSASCATLRESTGWSNSSPGDAEIVEQHTSRRSIASRFGSAGPL